MKNRAMKGLVTLAMASFASVSLADWQFAPSSQINYVSVKNNAIAENNVITGVSGGLTRAGELSVVLDLTTVDTGVQIRNERMQQMLFEVFDFGTATLEGSLSATQLASLQAGEVVRAALPLELNLHGVTQSVTAELLAVPHAGGVLVTSTAPVLINAGDFGLQAGVTALQEIAGLNSISRAVPVTVNLELVEAP